MRSIIIGAAITTYEGKEYGRVYGIEPREERYEGIGRQAVIYKCDPSVSRMVQKDKLDCEYDLQFNRNGRLVQLEPCK